MNLKEKTQEELEGKIAELENKIAQNGIGSEYLSKQSEFSGMLTWL